jgi:predicted AlkP superfamily pyrophosphatase or phosphodiesterase
MRVVTDFHLRFIARDCIGLFTEGMACLLRNSFRSSLIVFAFFLSQLAVAQAAPVLMISIDGLKPECVTHAAEHGLRVPTLRRFLSEGSYADGVVAVLPTVTYPDHTTLITGVWPAEHGIVNNTVFDPKLTMDGAWYWYAGDIRVPTLWDAAHQKGIRTASVSWPVSVNATSVDTLIPEYWRTSNDSVDPEDANRQDVELMAAISRPEGLLFDLQKRLGPYMMGNDTTVEGDRVRTRYSLDILEHQKPGFMTVHLSALDESEHVSGVYSEDANKTLEAVDGMVAELIDAAKKNDPKTVVVIVSDHGFVNVHHALNIAIPFLEAGLIEAKTAANGKVTVLSWKAGPWATGGLAAIMLHDPSDAKTREEARLLLTRLAADPANGIARILEKAEIKQAGGFPDAEFVLALQPGFTMGSALSGALVSDRPPVKGTHGYLPSYPEMRASFFVMGEGVARGRDLGVIDMRQIAPTVAGILGVSLPAAKEPALKLAR